MLLCEWAILQVDSLCSLYNMCIMYVLQGKGDGLAIDTSGLTDNWDDAEGRYCKFSSHS